MTGRVQPKPRVRNAYLDGGSPLVVKVPHLNGDYLQDSVHAALDLLGGLARIVKPGDAVLLKPNFNAAYATPLSTDLGVLAAVIESLQDCGARVTVGEMCGRMAWPTEQVIDKLGVPGVLRRYGVPFVNFEHDEWLELEVPGRHWRILHVPRTMYEAETRVYLANMRCHSSARFSCSLKLGVGWISPDDREDLHRHREATEAMVPEVHLGWQPQMVLVDGRRSTVGWHGRGEYVRPNVLMASGDMVAVDTEAVKILKQFGGTNRLDLPVGQMAQLTVAQSYGLGSMEYIMREAPAHLRTEQEAVNDPSALEIARAIGLPEPQSL
jgi:uncharacterized protein (DUF362 family)